MIYIRPAGKLRAGLGLESRLELTQVVQIDQRSNPRKIHRRELASRKEVEMPPYYRKGTKSLENGRYVKRMSLQRMKSTFCVSFPPSFWTEST